MRIAIATAAEWLPSRRLGLSRLRNMMPDVEVYSSPQREHASIWARRVWEAAGDDAICILNDDVHICPSFSKVIDRMCQDVPDQVISLHTTAAIAPSLAMCGVNWLRSYWLTGPGYILPRGAAKRLLAWVDQAPRQLIASRNEDNVIMHWAWSEQRPIWHCIPGLVQHDTGVPSTLGYDNHPGRTCNVPWTEYGIPTSWAVTEPPLLVECPWMPQVALASIERAYWQTNSLCCVCHTNPGKVNSSLTGASVCAACVVNMVSSLVHK